MQTAPTLRAVDPSPEMAARPRWMHYSKEPRRKPDGSIHYAKVPYYIDGERRRGDLGQDGNRLVTYAEAVASLPLYGDTRSGLGFALGADGRGGHWQGVDFDKVNARPELEALVAQLPGYVELSPSGNGYHAIGYGAPFPTLGSNASGIEAYSEGRFFTFTGWALRQGPLVDLGPFVSLVLTPRHAAHRKAREVPPSAAVASSGEREVDELADALRYLDPDDRDTWIRVGQALYTLGEKGYALWAAWSATSKRFPGGDDLERFETFSGTRTGWQSIFNQAAAVGWKNPRKLDPAAIFAGSSLVAVPGGAAANAPRMPMPLPPAVPGQAPPVPAYTGPAAGPVGRLGGADNREPDGSQRAATLENVVDCVGPTSGVIIKHDTFTDALLIGTSADKFRPFTDTDYAKLRMTLGRSGFKPVSPEVMKSAVAIVATENTFDSAEQWAASLVWDGVPRIDAAMPRYYRTPDTPYTRAVGAYLFTALAGRALTHPLQCDMAVILVGMQGARKTSAVAALAPSPITFAEINLGKSDEDIARRLRGKFVVEWAEMRGLAGRDLDGIKAWITRKTESWVPKYKEFETTFDRRCIVIGTANTVELLDDPTGERRWLPVMAGEVDVEAIVRDRDQLWAEGCARFKASGVAWADAERLARDEHAAFKVSDEWAGLVHDWLMRTPLPKVGEKPPTVPNCETQFQLSVCANEALGIRPADLRKSESERVGKILRNFGYEKFNKRTAGVVLKFWRRAETL